MGSLLGVILHAIGGFAAGTFYVPFKRVKDWAWETYWLVNGAFAWMIMPWVVAFITVPIVIELLSSASFESLFWSYFFGLLWGIGGFTFGLTMRYLGLSLGMAVALGFCAAFGTIIPPIYYGQFGTLISTTSGLVIIAGVSLCLIGIGICGWAGFSKEKELSDDEKKATIEEFALGKGLIVGVIAGILSACFAFGLQAGKPIASMAVEQGVSPLWQNGPTLILILAGGFTLNFIWCIALNIKNKTITDYVDTKKPMSNNYLFSAMAGIIWYFQFMFYGMGTSKMGQYDFASWTLHMAFIIVFSNLWGMYFKEWKGSSKKTIRLMFLGLFVVISSTAVIGIGSYIAQLGE